MENMPDKICRGNHKTHFIISNFLSENPAVYGIMWKYMPEPEKPQMTI
jgi:hypothetical protein